MVQRTPRKRTRWHQDRHVPPHMPDLSNAVSIIFEIEDQEFLHWKRKSNIAADFTFIYDGLIFCPGRTPNVFYLDQLTFFRVFSTTLLQPTRN
jgi:hypothetical protein